MLEKSDRFRGLVSVRAGYPCKSNMLFVVTLERNHNKESPAVIIPDSFSAPCGDHTTRPSGKT